MSVETIHNNSEQEVSATPTADRVLIAAKIAAPELSEPDLVLLRNSFRMVGLGYAQVLVRYEQDMVEDGALDRLYKIYCDKIAIHVPNEVKDQFADETYGDILDEYAQVEMHKAELEIITAPVISMITTESFDPDENELHRRQIHGLEQALNESQADLNRATGENAKLQRTIDTLRAALLEQQVAIEKTDVISRPVVEKDDGEYQVVPEQQRRSLGGFSLVNSIT